MGKVMARYTLSGDTTIYISKDKFYDLYQDENGKTYIIDNMGERYYPTRETLAERFKTVEE